MPATAGCNTQWIGETMKTLMLYIALAVGASAAEAQIAVHQPWVRGTLPGQDIAAGYMEIHSSKAVSLVKVTSPVAKMVEMHETRMEGDVNKMRAVKRIDVPAGGSVALKPGGYHLMLMGVTKPLQAGQTVPFSLVFETADGKRSSVEVKAPVRQATAGAAPMDHGMMHMH